MLIASINAIAPRSRGPHRPGTELPEAGLLRADGADSRRQAFAGPGRLRQPEQVRCRLTSERRGAELGTTSTSE